MFLHGVITELTHFSEAGLPPALQILMHLLTRILMSFVQSSEAQEFSGGWFVNVIFIGVWRVLPHWLSCWRNKTTPCSLSHLWLETPPQSSVQGPQYRRSIYLPPYQTRQWHLSLIPLLVFIVTWAEQHLWVVVCEESSSWVGHLHRWSVAVCMGPRWAQVPLPCLGLQVSLFLQCPRESGPRKGLWSVLVWLLVILQMCSSTSEINHNLVWKSKCFAVQLIF